MRSNTYETNKLKPNDQSGAALVIAIFAILLLTIIGFAIISTGLTSQNIAKNSREQTESFYISESGLTHATQILLQTNPTEFNSILQAGDGVAGTGDELSTRPSALTPIPLAGLTFGNGYYIVKISDDSADTDGNPNADSNKRIVITSTGYGQNGATVTSEAIIGISEIPGMLLNSDAEITGNVTLRGTAGSVHANGTLTLDGGGPCADQYFSSTGTIVNPNRAMTGAGCTDAGSARENQTIIDPPTWNIRSSFYNRADYILGAIGASAGKVYDGTGALIVDTSTTGNVWTIAPGTIWTWDPLTGTWTSGGNGNSMPDATFYSEGNIRMQSAMGSAASPKQMTLIAEGYISLAGSSFLRPDLDNFALMAGTDLRGAGNPSGGINFEGILYAGHQVDFAGSPAINGLVIAANIADTDSPFCGCNLIPLVSGRMRVGGSPTITYNGGILNSFARIVSWREIRY